MARKRKSDIMEQVNVEVVEEVKVDEQLEQPKQPKPKQQQKPVDLSKITITRERRHL